jgi:hypothetical protein
MNFDLNRTCGQHPNRFDCPDALIAQVRRGYGIIVHDGGSSVIEIAFCPWCGSQLPQMRDPDEAVAGATDRKRLWVYRDGASISDAGGGRVDGNVILMRAPRCFEWLREK